MAAVNNSLERSDVPIPQDVPITNKRAWGMTGLVLFLYVVNYADKAVLGIIAQPLAQDLGLGNAQIGMVGSLFFVTFTIGGFLAGPLARYLTLRWALLALAIVWSIAMLPLVVAASLTMLVVSRMLLGLAEGPSSALMHTAAYSWHPAAKRGLPSALLLGSASVAKIALAPVLTFVSIEYGWRAAILALSGLGMVWAVCWLLGWKDGPFTGKATNADPVGAVEHTVDVLAGAEPSVAWKRIFSSPTFWSCAVLAMVMYGLTTIVLTWLPSYFELGLGYTRLQAGSMFAAPSIVALILMVSTGSVTDKLIQRGSSSRLVRIIVPCIGVLVCGAVLATLPLIKIPVLAVIVLSIGYACGMIALPLVSAAVSELCPPQQTAGTMGGFMAIAAIGGLVSPYATGVIVDHASTPGVGYGLAFQGIGVLGAFAAILVLIFANPGRDRSLIRESS